MIGAAEVQIGIPLDRLRGHRLCVQEQRTLFAEDDRSTAERTEGLPRLMALDASCP